MAFDLATARPAEEVDPPPPAAAPPPAFDPKTAKPASYVGDWWQGVKDAATQPVGGPTGIPLVDAAAGVADFGLSAVADTLTAVPRLATQAFVGARGGRAPPDLFTREPTTPTGRAIQDTVGAAFRPVGDALNATGVDPGVAQFLLEGAGAAADAFGVGAGFRGAKAGARVARPMSDVPWRNLAGAPDPAKPGSVAELGAAARAVDQPLGAERAALAGVQQVMGAELPEVRNPRPFGASVEQARRMGFRVLPSQVAGAAQEAAAKGKFGFHRKVPGTMLEGLVGNDFVASAIIDNSKRVDAFVAKELGLEQLTEQGFRLAKNPHSAVYDEVVRALPTLKADRGLRDAADAIDAARRGNILLDNIPQAERIRERMLVMEKVDTQHAIDAMNEFRQMAASFYKQADNSVAGSEKAKQAGDAYRKAALALEDAIERQVSPLYPDLVPRLRDARTALAKIHNVEDAFDGKHVDPQALLKLSKGFPLTGYLKEIADVARDFPDTMQSATGRRLAPQSWTGALLSTSLFGRRLTGQEQGPRILADAFQNRFGLEDPTFDPRPPPTPRGATPFADYTPPDPNVPGGADVMPPAPGGGPPALTTSGLAEDFIDLPPAENFPGDLTASTPPMGGSEVPFTDTGLAEALAGALGLETPPRRFTAGTGGVLDEGLPFAPDPEMASASIVRGGPPPSPVADSPALAEALLGAELRGRPLDPATGAGLAPEGIDQPFTRPAPGLGEDLGVGFGEPPTSPLLRGPEPPLEGEWIPGVGPQPRPGFDPYEGVVDADLAELLGLPAPQRRLPAPDEPPRAPPPMSEEDAFWTEFSRDPEAAQGPAALADEFDAFLEDDGTYTIVGPDGFRAFGWPSKKTAMDEVQRLVGQKPPAAE